MCSIVRQSYVAMPLKIMETHNPIEQSRIGLKIAETGEWIKRRESAMAEAIDMKFKQNQHIRKILFATNSKNLIAANPHEKFLGTGLSVHENKAVPSAKWPGMNTLERLMENACENLK